MRFVCIETPALDMVDITTRTSRLHVAEDNYKLNIYHSPSPEPNDCPGELFNLDDDVGEMNNLWFSDRHRDTRDQLVHRLTTFLVKQDSKGRVDNGTGLAPRI